VNHPQARQYQKMSQLLDAHPEIEAQVRQDLVHRLKEPNQGRDGMSARQVLRVLVVKQLTQLSYKDLPFHIADSATWCRFCGFDGPCAVPKKSAMQDNVARLGAGTLEQINRLLLGEAKEQRVESGQQTRTDCTVVATPIHRPTDSSLLWDGIRRLVLGREVYGKVPQRAAFDGAFTSRENLRKLKEMGIKQVAFSKRRGIPIEEMCSSPAVYRRLRRFRAGVEGCISFLKRALGLGRCLWKGPQGFRAYVWGSVLAANLLTLARGLL
jgi:IS5 family transposase